MKECSKLCKGVFGLGHVNLKTLLEALHELDDCEDQSERSDELTQCPECLRLSWEAFPRM